MSDKQEVIQADREAVERDIRIAIWNGAKWQGSPDEVAQSLIRKVMEEPTMVRALEALAHLPNTDLSDERAIEVLRSVAGPSKGLCNVSDALRAMHQYAAGMQGEVERLRAVVAWADKHASNQDMNHVNYRIGVGSRARTALGDNQ